MIERLFEARLQNGIECRINPTDKFQTASVRLMLQLPLDKTTISLNALLPQLLRRGTQSYPSPRRIAVRLEELYGAQLVTGVGKAGDRYIMRFGIDLPTMQTDGSSHRLFSDAVALLADTMLRPPIENGSFRAEPLAREKENLSRRIRALKNDKTRYSLNRCTELMFSAEPFGLHPLGGTSDVEAIDAHTLYDHWNSVMTNAYIHVFVMGNVEPETVVDTLSRLLDFPDTGRTAISSSPARPIKAAPRSVYETEPVNQGKLTVGFKTGITLEDPLYHALALFNTIYGGFTGSKLFLDVREKHGLAYYAQSMLDAAKGAMYALAGVDPKNRERAIELVLDRFEACRAGDFSDHAAELAKASLVHRLRAAQDSIPAVIGSHYEHLLAGSEVSVEEQIHRIKELTRHEVVEASQRVMPDTIHFLGPEEVGC